MQLQVMGWTVYLFILLYSRVHCIPAMSPAVSTEQPISASPIETQTTPERHASSYQQPLKKPKPIRIHSHSLPSFNELIHSILHSPDPSLPSSSHGIQPPFARPLTPKSPVLQPGPKQWTPMIRVAPIHLQHYPHLLQWSRNIQQASIECEASSARLARLVMEMRQEQERLKERKKYLRSLQKTYDHHVMQVFIKEHILNMPDQLFASFKQESEKCGLELQDRIESIQLYFKLFLDARLLPIDFNSRDKDTAMAIGKYLYFSKQMDDRTVQRARNKGDYQTMTMLHVDKVKNVMLKSDF